MRSNWAKIIAVAALAVVAFLLLVQPWRAHRYDNTPAGAELRRWDERVATAIETRDTWEVAEFLGQAPTAGVDYPSMLAGMSHADALKLVADLRKAGVSNVLLINVRSGLHKSAGPEAIAIALPQDQARRRQVWATANGFFSRSHIAPPPDLRQKYLCLPLRVSALTTTQGSG